jgi:hypothetical protein
VLSVNFRTRCAMIIAIAVIVLVFATSLGLAAKPLAADRIGSPRAVRTFVFQGGKRFGYIRRDGFQRPGDRAWRVSWAPEEGAVAHEERGWFFSYCEGYSPRDRVGLAQPRTRSSWVVKDLPSFRRVGTLQRTTTGWDIFVGRVRRASTRGPDGVAAGVAYLTLGCF